MTTTTTTTAEPGSARRRRDTARRWLLTGATLGVAGAMLLGLLNPLVALPMIGLALAGLAGPSQGPEVRTVTASRRTVAAAAGTMIGLALLIATPSLGRGLLQHLALDAVEVLIAVLSTVAIASLAAPLAMSEAPGTGRTAALTRRNLILATTGVLILVEAHLAGISYLVMTGVAALPLGLLAVRVVAARRDGVRVRRVQAANEVLFWALLAATTTTGAFDVVAAGVPAGIVRAVVAALCVIGVLAALIPGRRRLVATNVMVLAGSVFLASQLAGTFHPPADASALPSPVRGEWFVVNGGRSGLVNGHRAALVQDDAFDIVQLVGGSTYRGDPARMESYYCYGEPVLAPVAGRVVTVVEDLPDQRIGSVDVINTAGNRVVIDIGGGRYVAFAHLRPGSVTVAVGDAVRPGQQVGEVGNSGNSDQPHLHLQVQNVPGFDVITPPDGARTYPWLLRDVTLTRAGHTTHQAAADLRRGDVFAS